MESVLRYLVTNYPAACGVFILLGIPLILTCAWVVCEHWWARWSSPSARASRVRRKHDRQRYRTWKREGIT